ncbi:MAG: hypothetical protein M3552_13590 [Planctomycetota bacterium]|nr:hypothetical protein [Planctomycetaceae bacterium]MDQ3331665.1 hypothetical protein [Planctomycetota bacterium]
MDALYFLKHSQLDDVELRYSLRSIERHLPWIRRVIIFGDRPDFLAGSESGVIHVPHRAIAWIGNYRTPVSNFFLLFYLSALLPEVSDEYVFFSDDFVLLEDLSPERARQMRYLEDLSQIGIRGRGLWKEGLWRTYDTLTRLGFGGLNFETHVPTVYHKRWVLDAFKDLRDYVTEDRWYGLTGPTAILNHAHKMQNFPLVNIRQENSRAGFYGQPPAHREIVERTNGRLFLSYDDEAFGADLPGFLRDRFPEPCRYEREYAMKFDNFVSILP